MKNICYTGMTNGGTIMLALRLPEEIEIRLDALAKATGRAKSYYAREAILTHQFVAVFTTHLKYL
jgi:predicted transcriptional regulator